jgi:hypothetical protein
MATAGSETGCLDWDDFRALEHFAIIYDIAIDEEQYNPEWCQLTPPRGSKFGIKPIKIDIDAHKPWATHRYVLFSDPTSSGDLPDVAITASFGSSEWPLPPALKPVSTGSLTLPAPRPGSEDRVPTLWRKLLLAKHVRAKLQKVGSTTAFDALDKLGIALLRAMPLLECDTQWRQLDDLQRQLLILKILFLNEAAACYLGYQSISLADDCLNLIKGVVGEGETPHELVALYNKAQGYLHVHKYDDALREFEEVTGVDRETSAQETDHYFDSDNLKKNPLSWPGQRKLFDAYVRYPSLLQSAETLLNLQRSGEAAKRLPEENAAVPEPATAYQRARSHILIEKLKNDRSPGETAPKWPKDDVEPVNLALQRLAVDSEWALARCKLKTAEALQALHGDTPSDPMKAIHDALVVFRRALMKLRTRMQRAAKNRSEIDEACLSWAEGLSACQDLISFALSEKFALYKEDVVGNCRGQVLEGVRDYFHLGAGGLVFRNVAIGLCTDPGYRDHDIEVRKTLIKHLYGIQDLRYREVMPGQISEGFHDLLEEIAAYLNNLLDHLISEFSKPPRSVAKFVSEIEIRGWREQVALLTKLPLPGEGDDPIARHDELRGFVSYGFVHPTEHSLNPSQRRAEQKEWEDCRKHQCVGEGGKPNECGELVFARNPSFTPAEDGSNTLLHHLDRLVLEKRNLIDGRLYTQREHDSGWHFVVLQRWNSFTPAMRASEGGGYFLFHAPKRDDSKNVPGTIDAGVVIDPGYGFVKNFVSEGFGVCDITAIVITHDHPDHLADVDSLVNLLFEARKNRGGAARKVPKVERLLSRGAFERLKPLIESARDVFRDTVVLKPRTEYPVWEDGTNRLVLRACLALHRDASHLSNRSGFDSVGLVGEIRDGRTVKGRIGIPSDTKWDAQISRDYTGESLCGLICLHLDSIMPERFSLTSYFDAKQTRVKVLHEKQQLYLPGVVWYLEAIRKPHVDGMPTMVILSEFGEELAGGVRIDIARRLQAYTDEKREGKVVVLPGDVGLRVDPTGRTIRCSCCRLEHPWTTPFHCETSGGSEQIFYVCPWCLRNFTQQERAEVFSGHHAALPEIKS